MNLGAPDPSALFRARLKPWLMAAVRLGAGWLVARAAFLALLSPESVFRMLRGAWLADGFAVLLGAGLLSFAWPRTCLAGAAAFALALATFEWWWRAAGGQPGPIGWSLGIVGVLALGEWLGRRVRARYPGT